MISLKTTLCILYPAKFINSPVILMNEIKSLESLAISYYKFLLPNIFGSILIFMTPNSSQVFIIYVTTIYEEVLQSEYQQIPS